MVSPVCEVLNGLLWMKLQARAIDCSHSSRLPGSSCVSNHCRDITVEDYAPSTTVAPC